MSKDEWNLFANNLQVGHSYRTNQEYLDSMKSRVLFHIPSAEFQEEIIRWNNQPVLNVVVKHEEHQLSFMVKLPLTAEFKRKA